MSLKLNERYPGRMNNPSADYPQGSFKNRTAPSAKDGSYLEKDWANDKEGFFQSLLSAAGIIANGAVDKVGASQFFDALQALKQIQAGTAFTTGGTPSAQTLTPTPAISAYAAPLRFRVKFSQASTGSGTINVSGIGAKILKQYDYTGAKVAATYVVGQLADIEYDGTDFVVLDQLPANVALAQSGVVGGSRNLQMSVTAASATATITADEVIVEAGAFGALQYRLSSFSKLINLAITGAGGMDTGTAPLSGFVGIYVIYNPSLALSTTNPALLAQNATPGALGNIYGGANMPTGYTASALVSVWPTNGSGQLAIGFQTDRTINTAPSTVLASGSAASYTPFSLSAAVPFNAKSFNGQMTTPGSASTTGYMSAASAALAEKRVGGYTGSGAQAPSAPFSNHPIITAQTAYYYQVGSNGVQIQANGYTI